MVRTHLTDTARLDWFAFETKIYLKSSMLRKMNSYGVLRTVVNIARCLCGCERTVL